MDWPNKPASIDLAVIFEFCDKNVSKCLKHGGLQIISSLFNVYSMSIQSLSNVSISSDFTWISLVGHSRRKTRGPQVGCCFGSPWKIPLYLANREVKVEHPKILKPVP